MCYDWVGPVLGFGPEVIEDCGTSFGGGTGATEVYSFKLRLSNFFNTDQIF